jgi:hypothetical protein
MEMVSVFGNAVNGISMANRKASRWKLKIYSGVRVMVVLFGFSAEMLSLKYQFYIVQK